MRFTLYEALERTAMSKSCSRLGCSNLSKLKPYFKSKSTARLRARAPGGDAGGAGAEGAGRRAGRAGERRAGRNHPRGGRASRGAGGARGSCRAATGGARGTHVEVRGERHTRQRAGGGRAAEGTQRSPRQPVLARGGRG